MQNLFSILSFLLEREKKIYVSRSLLLWELLKLSSLHICIGSSFTFTLGVEVARLETHGVAIFSVFFTNVQFSLLSLSLWSSPIFLSEKLFFIDILPKEKQFSVWHWIFDIQNCFNPYTCDNRSSHIGVKRALWPFSAHFLNHTYFINYPTF